MVVLAVNSTALFNLSANYSVASTQPVGRTSYLALLLICIPTLTIFGNVLVVMAVWRERSLRTVTNFMIVSLAVADFCVALCVMSFAVYFEVNHLVWGLGQLVCNVYIAMDVCCSTASILNLVAISVDRYIAITRPIAYSKYGKDAGRAGLFILVVWLVSICVAVPILLGVNKLNNPDVECEFTNAYYIVFSSLMSFFIPCIAMLCLYAVIVKRLRDRQRAKATTRMRARTRSEPRDGGERISAALLGGAKFARDMGKRLRDRTDEILLETSSFPTPSSTSSEEDSSTVSPSGARPHDLHATSKRCLAEQPSGSDCTTTQLLQPARPEIDVLVEREQVSAARSFGDELTDLFPFIDSNSRGNSLRAKSAPTLNLDTVEDFSGTPKNSIRLCPASEVPKRKPLNHHSRPRLHLPVKFTKTAPLSNSPRTVRKRRRRQLNNHLIDSKGNNNNNSNNNNKNMAVMRNASKLSSLSMSISVSRPERSVTDSLRVCKDELWRRLTGMRLRSFKPTSKHLAKKAQKQIRKEHKATVTLAIVLAVFLICWVPFFTLHLTNAVCIIVHGEACIHFLAFFLTTWLGYMNSFMNPIIYTIYNPQYRRAFRRILFCDGKRP